MARPVRIEFPNAVYHVTSRGNRRKRIVNDDRDRERFLAYLAGAVERFGWVISSATLLTNHFHLVLRTPKPNLARGMQWLNACYASYYNRRHRVTGHLFGERYKAIHVQSEEYLKRLVRYVVLNPVRAKIVTSPDDYAWSSYGATAGLCETPSWLSTEDLIPLFGDASTWRQNYAAYVREGIGQPDPIWRGIRRNVCLGTEQWLQAVGQKMTKKLRKSDAIPLDQRAVGLPAMSKILNRIADAYGMHAKDLRRRHGGILRELAAWLGVYAGMRRLRVIAQSLGLRSISRVTQLVQQFERRLRRDGALRKEVDELRLSLV